MGIDRSHVTTAVEMAALATQLAEKNPCQAFICYWAAFHNVCTSLAAQAGLRPRFVLNRNGTRKSVRVGAVKITVVDALSAQEQIDAACGYLSPDLKHLLIIHPGTRFFVYRKPTWLSKALEKDALGQRLNGVIDASRTIDPRYPVWSPIDVALYRRYIASQQDGKARDALVGQILDLLGTIQRNLLQGGLRDDQESSPPTVAQALPLLSTIVSHFVSPQPDVQEMAAGIEIELK